MNQISKSESVRDSLDAILVTLAYMGMKCENNSTGIFTKKHMCETMKSMEIDLTHICHTLQNLKEMV